MSSYFSDSKLNEECGVFGVFNHSNASGFTYYGLHALQHRGQEACGIATSDNEEVYNHKNKGLVTEVFDHQNLAKLVGNNAIGHVRYSTYGANQIENIQPLMVRAHTGHFGVVHNGQIVNAKELKIYLEKTGSIFQGTTDSEILIHLIQREKGNMIEKICKACLQLEGSFAFIILTKDCMYAIRDKNGLRPLTIGTLGEGYCVSSETCAFEVVGAKILKDINPGEIAIFKNNEEIEYINYTDKIQHRMCAMEYIYFARPDSVIEGVNVHAIRRKTGKLLAQNDNVEADIVIGVPDSSISAAMGYSDASGIPYEIGLLKNRYVGRTFIQPSQELRENGVRMKLSTISAIVKDKNIILVDDSLVRGTTSKRIVRLLKQAGAKKIHVRIASPRIISPCFYGVDISTLDELIAARKNNDELRDFIEADSLKFLEVDELKTCITDKLCLACFNKDYIGDIYSFKDKLKGDK